MAAVFLNYSQKELDDAYDQLVYAPNRAQVLDRYEKTSEIVRQRIGAPERFAYGPTRNEGLDFYAAKPQDAPIVVFVHGGAWLRGLAKNYAFPAEMLVRAGVSYAALDFDNVTETAGTLFPMAEQVRKGIAWVYRKFAPARLYVAGSSSGAHLGGCAAITDWEKDFGIPADAVKGYVLCSGMFDLRGPRLSKRSEYVKFTDAMEHELSPQRHLGRIRAPITLLYGSLETPEFQRQSRDFAAALRAAGKPVELIHAEGYNHFEIAETFSNPYGPCGRALLKMVFPPSG